MGIRPRQGIANVHRRSRVGISVGCGLVDSIGSGQRTMIRLTMFVGDCFTTVTATEKMGLGGPRDSGGADVRRRGVGGTGWGSVRRVRGRHPFNSGRDMLSVGPATV